MDTSALAYRDILGPIDHDWTIASLLDWLSDDARQRDEALREPLVAIDTVLTGSPWRRSPSTVAVTRSIAAVTRTSPWLLSRTIAELLSPAASAAEPSRRTAPYAYRATAHRRAQAAAAQVA